MCLASNIARRAGSASYYARLGIPKDLQSHYPRTPTGELKRELWQSLRTKDAREAKARAPAVLARWNDEFAALRHRLAAIEPSAAQLSAATFDHYQGEIERHHDERRRLPSSAEIEAAAERLVADAQSGAVPWSDDPAVQALAVADVFAMRDRPRLNAAFRARRKAELERHLGIGEFVLVAEQAQALIERANYKLDATGFGELCRRLMRAEIEGLRRAEEHDRGDYTGTPRDPIITPPANAKAAPSAAPGEGILELFDQFAIENPRSVKADTLRMNREIVAWFAQHVGTSAPAKVIDKRAVRSWKQALARFPIKAAEVRELRGLPFNKIVAENERLQRPTLSVRTINKYLSALGAFCAWLVANDHLEANPVAGMHLGESKGETKVRPYTDAQLTAIFRSPMFTGCQSDEQEHLPGNVRVRDHRYWLPLLALFTGARMGELAQLHVADVRQDRGRWILHITREGDAEKSTKTKGSQRVVPVHPELERLGFIAFRAARVAAGGARLFPEIKPDARGQLAGNYSRFWGRYAKRIGVKDDATVNFHSFRHGIADAFRRAGFLDEQFGFLLGHTKASTTGRYGILAEGELSQRCAMIDAVKFEDFDLKHLYDPKTD